MRALVVCPKNVPFNDRAFNSCFFLSALLSWAFSRAIRFNNDDMDIPSPIFKQIVVMNSLANTNYLIQPYLPRQHVRVKSM
jgi:hypothetical protein